MTLRDTIKQMAAGREVARLLRIIDQQLDHVVDLTLELAKVPAPAFHEEARGRMVEKILREIATRGMSAAKTGKLLDVWKDGAGNVVARFRGGSQKDGTREDQTAIDGGGKSLGAFTASKDIEGSHCGYGGGHGGVLLVAHLDSVLSPTESAKGVYVDIGSRRMFGPGVGDNALAIAALIVTARLLADSELRTTRDLYFAFSVGEEGLGDLRGMKAIWEALKGDVLCVVAVEGHFLGRVCNEGVGSVRFEIGVEGPGGHSWEDAPTPSAVHGLIRIAGRLIDLWESKRGALPRTSFNIGCIDGGTSINAIAARASMKLDIRSTDRANLEFLKNSVLRVIAENSWEEGPNSGLRTNVRVIGERPAGSIDASHPLVMVAKEALSLVGICPEISAASTDANVPLADGCPSVALGVTRGGGMHSQEEWIEIDPIPAGIKSLLLTTLALCGIA